MDDLIVLIPKTTKHTSDPNIIWSPKSYLSALKVL